METRKLEVGDPAEIVPNDIMKYIFSYLKDHELHEARLVNKKWKKITDEVRELHYKKTFQEFKILEGSELWRYLLAIAEGENITEFYEKYILFDNEILKNEKRITQHKVEKITLDELCSRMNIRFPVYRSYKEKLKSKYLQEKAQFIVATVFTEKTDLATTWKDFWKFSLALEKKQSEVFLVYKEMEAIFAFMAIILEFSMPFQDATGPLAQRPTDLIIANPQIRLWLTGEGLVLISNYYFNLISGLMDRAVNSDSSQDPISSDAKTFAQEMLRKISLANWLDFWISTRAYNIDYDKFEKLFRDGATHGIFKFSKDILQELLEIVSVRKKHSFFNMDVGTQALKSDTLIKQLKDDELVELITNLSIKKFANLVDSKPSFLPRLDLKLFAEFLRKKRYDFLVSFLERNEFLNKLSWEEIKKLQALYPVESFYEVIVSSNNIVPKLTNSQLGELACANPLIARDVLRNYLHRLTDKDLQKIIDNGGSLGNDLVEKAINENERRIKKEKSALEKYTFFSSLQNFFSALPTLPFGGLFSRIQPAPNLQQNSADGKAEEEDKHTLTPTLSRNNVHHT